MAKRSNRQLKAVQAAKARKKRRNRRKKTSDDFNCRSYNSSAFVRNRLCNGEV